MSTSNNGDDGKQRAAEQYQQGYLPPVQQQSLENTAGKQTDLPADQENLYLPTEWNHVDGAAKSHVTKYRAAAKLQGKHALITGGDSGIGRSTSILFAMEDVAKVVIHYLPEREEQDARQTEKLIQSLVPEWKGEVHLIAADMRQEANVESFFQDALKKLDGRVDILFNNAGFQREVESIEDLAYSQIVQTFQVNILSLMLLTKLCVPHMPRGGSIINNASINHYVGHPKLLDYSATKGAIIAFTRALSNQIVAERSIRVNAVCPGPVWTPLPPATMGTDSLESFGTTTPMKRPGQPVEVATCVVFLAGPDSSYISGQSLHPNGGVVVNS